MSLGQDGIDNIVPSTTAASGQPQVEPPVVLSLDQQIISGENAGADTSSASTSRPTALDEVSPLTQ
eukprot:2515255-Pyramimonas_sp.AAC.1